MDSNEFEELKAQVARLEQEVSAVRQRLRAMESTRGEEASAPASTTPPASTPPPAPTSIAPPASRLPQPPPIPPLPRPAQRDRSTQGQVGRIPFPPSQPREPSAISLFASRAWRQYGPPSDLSWEMALGTWWFPRIGAGVICIAMVWLMTYYMGQLPEA